MSGRELTGWIALEQLHAEEAEHARNVAESGDGVVHYHGREEDDDEDEDAEDDEDELIDGQTE